MKTIGILLLCLLAASTQVNGALTTEGANTFIKEWLSLMHTTFAENTFSESESAAMKNIYADNVEWDWVGGQKGKGTRAEFNKMLGDSWGAMSKAFLPSNEFVNIDTKTKVFAT